MAQSTEELLDAAVAATAAFALDASGGNVTQITIDLQPSGELPYRLEVPDYAVPLAGLTRLEQGPNPNSGQRRPVAPSRTGD